MAYLPVIEITVSFSKVLCKFHDKLRDYTVAEAGLEGACNVLVGEEILLDLTIK